MSFSLYSKLCHLHAVLALKHVHFCLCQALCWRCRTQCSVRCSKIAVYLLKQSRKDAISSPWKKNYFLLCLCFSLCQECGMTVLFLLCPFFPPDTSPSRRCMATWLTSHLGPAVSRSHITHAIFTHVCHSRSHISAIILSLFLLCPPVPHLCPSLPAATFLISPPPTFISPCHFLSVCPPIHPFRLPICVHWKSEASAFFPLVHRN